MNLGNEFVLDNDGLHSADMERRAAVNEEGLFLETGLLQKSGDQDLRLRWSYPV